MNKQNTVYHLLREAANYGYTFKVAGLEGYEEGVIDYVGDDWQQAFEASKLEGAANIWISKEGAKTEWLMAIYFNDPDESLSDCTAEGWIDNWCTATDFGQKYQPLTWSLKTKTKQI